MKLLKSLVGCYAIIVTTSINANSIDSLRSLLTDKNQNPDLNVYFELQSEYQDINIDSAIYFAEKGLELAIENHNNKKVGEFNVSLGILHSYKGLSEIAVDYFSDAYFAYLNDHDSINAMAQKINMATIFIDMGKYTEASNLLFETLLKAERWKDVSLINNVHGLLGYLYLYQEEFEKSINHSKIALKDKLKANSPDDVAALYNNIGIAFYQLGKPDSVVFYFKKSLTIYRESNNRHGQINPLFNIGEAYYLQNKWDLAFDYFNQALVIEKELGFELSYANSLGRIGDYYAKSGNIKKALEYRYKSLRELIRLKATADLSKAYYHMSEIYTSEQKYDSALHYHILYSQLNDSLLTVDRAKQVAELETVYETEKKEKEILRLTREQERKQNVLFLLIFIISLMFFLIVFLIVFYRTRQKAIIAQTIAKEQKRQFNTVLNAQEDERKRIATELHDSIGPLLSVTRLYISELADSIKDTKKEHVELFDKSIQILDNACNEMRGISHNLMPGVLIRSGLGSACKELIENINKTKSLTIHFKNNGYDRRVDETIEINYYRILQELINNIIKHSKATQVDVALNKTNHQLSLSVQDNGIGFDIEKANKTSGIGLHNIFSRLSLINGTIKIESSETNGTLFQVDCIY